MKHLKIAFLAVLLTIGFNQVNAQDKNNPWQIGFGVNAVDFYPTNAEGMISPAGFSTGWGDEFFNADDHYNMIPAITKITVGKYLADGFSFEVGGSLNKIEHIGNVSASDLSYFGVDGAVKYDLNYAFGETGWFDPYLTVGGGYTWMDDWDTGTFNGGVGFNLWFNDNIGLNLETRYKHTFESNITQHFQHAAGIVIKFGGTDTDGDGIFDKDDACPDVFGLEEFNGCPDTDADGIIDSKDACPEVAGLAELNGCPDADADGIADKDDACPNAKGTKANNGCPDTDGDGLVDKDDACPKVAGPKANKGCPWPDADADGVLDKDDACPKVAGPASNNGCPEITKVEVAKLEELFKTVYFDTGKDSFKDETVAKLDEAASIMKKYSTAKFNIAGHTDSVGSAKLNLELSSKRANAVKNYLASKGVSSSNLTAKGYGEEMPVASNNTRSGRSQNRRVEVKLVD
ncbi:OmpA family protein [Lutibacter sp. TH_r2]|uniref:OmpA family protein n=1 Tax=Lutibacter sp. TH_r2 TaxID=3082083 RepID=UPI002953E81C|nr:OmpA family protein [Lutibacter sp. TH_r2]MDV7186473.1 OmpA family protein [Lutibacter sp. TH_r2]